MAEDPLAGVQSQLDNLTLLSPPGFSLDLDPAAKLEASQAKLGSIVGELSAASPAAKAAKVSGDACNIFDSMGSLLSGPQEAIGAAADAAGDVAGDIAGSVGGPGIDTPGAPPAPISGIGDAVDGITDAAGGALSVAQEAAGAAAGAIGDSIGGAKDAIGSIMGQVGDFSAAFDEALPDIQGIAEGLKGASQEVLDVALPAFEGLNSAIAGINESVFGGIESALSSATDVLGEALDIGGAAGCESSAESAENLALEKAGELGVSLEGVASLGDLPAGALETVKGGIDAPSLKGVIQAGANEGLSLVESATSPGKTLADLGTESINGALAGAEQAAAAIGPATETMKSTISAQMNLLKNLPI